MKLLDLYCGAGGAAVGYHRAGFEVVGVDIAPQPNYPFEFHQADALDYPLSDFDVVHASPPCQAYSVARQNRRNNPPALIAPTRARLVRNGKPYIIENVMGAPLFGRLLILCGSMFNLGVRRHRMFEINRLIPYLRCDHASHQMFRIYGGRYRDSNFDAAQVYADLGIDWMTTWSEIKESVPPAYTEYIGKWLLTLI
jgi:DNA (cytosine-5)-methyltransferase 1